MTDIVEQLRAEGAMTGYYHVPAIQRKAAAEIEWLREESERLRAEVVSLEATGAEAADEIERLRTERDFYLTSAATGAKMELRLAEWLEAAKAEIERLRKELGGALILADMARDSSMGHQERAAIFRRALQDISNATMSQFVRASDLADYQMEIARAALAKEFDND